MKICPVCKAHCFDDMEVCYGCLHRFDADDAPVFLEETPEIDEPTRVLPVLNAEPPYSENRSVAPSSETVVLDGALERCRIVVEVKIEPRRAVDPKGSGRAKPKREKTMEHLPNPVHATSDTAAPHSKTEKKQCAGAPCPSRSEAPSANRANRQGTRKRKRRNRPPSSDSPERDGKRRSGAASSQ